MTSPVAQSLSGGRLLPKAVVTARLRRMALAESSTHPWLVVACVCVAGFLIQMDASIVGLMLPGFEVAFGVPVASAEWVSITYLLTLGVLVVPFGRLSDLSSRKMLYICGFGLFITGSALCGVAPAFGWLICARVVQAVGAAMLQANSPALVTAAMPRTQLARALATQGTAQTLGLLVGPLIGGLMVDLLDWRWAFFVGVPVGLAGVAASAVVLPATRHGVSPCLATFDWLGAGLLIPSLGLTFLGLTFGATWGWTSGRLTLVGVALLVALVMFVVYEARHPSPLIDFGLFRVRRLGLGIPSAACAYAALFGTLFLVPFSMERVVGASSGRVGLVLAALALPAYWDRLQVCWRTRRVPDCPPLRAWRSLERASLAWPSCHLRHRHLPPGCWSWSALDSCCFCRPTAAPS